MAGVAQALARIQGIAQRCANMTPITRVIASDLKTFIDTSFQQSKSAIDGSPFQPLSAMTIERRRHGSGSGSPKPLLDTGRLRSSVFARGTATGVLFGTNAVYARAQNFGNPTNRLFGRPGWHPIPARPFLPVKPDMSFGNAELLARFTEMVRHWLETGEFL